MKNRNKQRQERQKPPAQCDVVNLLHLGAPAIEAAGTLDRAISMGAVQCDRQTAQELRKMLPKSRGGTIDGPDVERDWENVVAEAVRVRNIDMTRMRLMYGPPSNN